MSWLSLHETEETVTSITEGNVSEWMGARLGRWRPCRLIWLGCNSYKCSALQAMLIHTMFLFIEGILNQARGASVPLHILAWAWGALSRNWAVGFYKKSESLYASWRWPCGGPLQVTWLFKTAVTWIVFRPNLMLLCNVNISTMAFQNMPVDGLVTWLLLIAVCSRITNLNYFTLKTDLVGLLKMPTFWTSYSKGLLTEIIMIYLCQKTFDWRISFHLFWITVFEFRRWLESYEVKKTHTTEVTDINHQVSELSLIISGTVAVS